VETSPAPPPRKRARRGIMSVDLTPVTSSVDEVTPMEVSTTKDKKAAADDSMFVCVNYIGFILCVCNCLVHMCRSVKWGSDEISVVVKIDGQCLMCFPEICEKIMLDHSTETLTKKLTNLKIELTDGSGILAETSHVHDTPSQICQMIQYQDLQTVLKHFNYKVPESFERVITSLENEVMKFIVKSYKYFNIHTSSYIY